MHYNQKKRFKIQDFSIDEIWNNNNLSHNEYNKLNNFYWFFSLDLKSSKKSIQSIVTNWIKYNHKYNHKSWDFDLTAKRIIAWLSCYNLTYEDSDQNYKEKFNNIIQKQTNHLINETNRSDLVDDKLIGCASIILVGLCYQDEKNYLLFGTTLLKKISKLALDSYGFPKSRNLEELTECFKYLILIREWIKESQNSMPEFLDDTIYNLGTSFDFINKNFTYLPLFNGSTATNNKEFKVYLNNLKYSFKDKFVERGGYYIIKNKIYLLK